MNNRAINKFITLHCKVGGSLKNIYQLFSFGPVSSCPYCVSGNDVFTVCNFVKILWLRKLTLKETKKKNRRKKTKKKKEIKDWRSITKIRIKTS